MMHTVLGRLIARLSGPRTGVSAAILTALIVLSGATTAGAQVLYGSIVGNVTDSTGGALPGAAVTITHEETRRTRETVTNAEGNYTFTAGQTGTYTPGVKLQGINALTPSDVMC